MKSPFYVRLYSRFALRLTDNHCILLSARRTPSVALESNLNRLIHFSHIVINARSIPSLKLIIYIIFRSSKTKLKERNNSVFGMAIELHGRITASGVRVFLLKSTNTSASSRHQLIRRPTILIASL